MKRVKSLEDYGLLSKGVIQTTENNKKQKRVDLTGMLLGTLVARLLRNMLASKEEIRTGN